MSAPVGEALISESWQKLLEPVWSGILCVATVQVKTPKSCTHLTPHTKQTYRTAGKNQTLPWGNIFRRLPASSFLVTVHFLWVQEATLLNMGVSPAHPGWLHSSGLKSSLCLSLSSSWSNRTHTMASVFLIIGNIPSSVGCFITVLEQQKRPVLGHTAGKRPAWLTVESAGHGSLFPSYRTTWSPVIGSPFWALKTQEGRATLQVRDQHWVHIKVLPRCFETPSLLCGQSGKPKFLSFTSSANLLPFLGILHGPHAAEHHGEPGPSDCMWWSHLSGMFNLSPAEWSPMLGLVSSENGHLSHGVRYPTRKDCPGRQHASS